MWFWKYLMFKVLMDIVALNNKNNIEMIADLL